MSSTNGAASAGEAGEAPMLLHLLQSMGLTSTANALMDELRQHAKERAAHVTATPTTPTNTAGEPALGTHAGPSPPPVAESERRARAPRPLAAPGSTSDPHWRPSGDTPELDSTTCTTPMRGPVEEWWAAAVSPVCRDAGARTCVAQLAALAVEPMTTRGERWLAPMDAGSDTVLRTMMDALPAATGDLLAALNEVARTDAAQGGSAPTLSPTMASLRGLLLQYVRALWLQQLLTECVMESDLLAHEEDTNEGRTSSSPALVLASGLQAAVQALCVAATARMHGLAVEEGAAERTTSTATSPPRSDSPGAELLRRVVSCLAAAAHAGHWRQDTQRVVQWVLHRHSPRTAPGPPTSSPPPASVARHGWGDALAALRAAVGMSSAPPPSAPSAPVEGSAVGREPVGEAAGSTPGSSRARQGRLQSLRTLFTLERARLALWVMQSVEECVWAAHGGPGARDHGNGHGNGTGGGSKGRPRAPLEEAAVAMEAEWAARCAAALRLHGRRRTGAGAESDAERSGRALSTATSDSPTAARAQSLSDARSPSAVGAPSHRGRRRHARSRNTSTTAEVPSPPAATLGWAAPHVEAAAAVFDQLVRDLLLPPSSSSPSAREGGGGAVARDGRARRAEACLRFLRTMRAAPAPPPTGALPQPPVPPSASEPARCAAAVVDVRPAYAAFVIESDTTSTTRAPAGVTRGAHRRLLRPLVRALATERLTLKSPRRPRRVPLRAALRRALGAPPRLLLHVQSTELPVGLQLRAVERVGLPTPANSPARTGRSTASPARAGVGVGGRDTTTTTTTAAAMAAEAPTVTAENPTLTRITTTTAAAAAAVHITEGDTHLSGSATWSATSPPRSPPMLGMGEVPPFSRQRARTGRGGGSRGTGTGRGAGPAGRRPMMREAVTDAILRAVREMTAMAERAVYAADRSNRQLEGAVISTDSSSDSEAPGREEDERWEGRGARRRAHRVGVAEGSDNDEEEDAHSGSDGRSAEEQSGEQDEEDTLSAASSSENFFCHSRDRMPEEVQQVAVTPCGSLMAMLTTRARLAVYALHGSGAAAGAAEYREELLLATRLPGTPSRLYRYDLCSALLQLSPDGRFLLAAVQYMPSGAPEGSEDDRVVPASTGRVCVYSLHARPATGPGGAEGLDDLLSLPDRLYLQVRAHAAPVTAARWAEPTHWGGGWTPASTVVQLSRVGRSAGQGGSSHPPRLTQVDGEEPWRAAAKVRLAHLQCFSAGMDGYLTRWLPSTGHLLQRLRTPPLQDLVVSHLMTALYTIDDDGHLAMYDAWNERDDHELPRAGDGATIVVRQRGLPAAVALLRTAAESASRARRAQVEPLADLGLPAAFFTGTRVIRFDRRHVPVESLAAGRAGGVGGAAATAAAGAQRQSTSGALAQGTASQQAAARGRQLIRQVLRESMAAPRESHILLSSSSSSSDSDSACSRGRSRVPSSSAPLTPTSSRSSTPSTDPTSTGEEDEEYDNDNNYYHHHHHRPRHRRRPADRGRYIRYPSGTRLRFGEVGTSLCHAAGLGPILVDRKMGVGNMQYRLLSMSLSTAAPERWAGAQADADEAAYRSLLHKWQTHHQQQQQQSPAPAAWFAAVASVRYVADATRGSAEGDLRVCGENGSPATTTTTTTTTIGALPLPPSSSPWRPRRRARLTPTASNGRYLSILAAVGPYRELVSRARPLEYRPGLYASLIFDTYTSSVLRVIPVCPVLPCPTLALHGTLPTHNHASKSPIYTLSSSLCVVRRPRGVVEDGGAGKGTTKTGRHEPHGSPAAGDRRSGSGSSAHRSMGDGEEEEEEEVVLLTVGGLHDTVYVYDALTGAKVKSLTLNTRTDPTTTTTATATAAATTAAAEMTSAHAAAGAEGGEGQPRKRSADPRSRDFDDVLSAVSAWESQGITTESTRTMHEPDSAAWLSSEPRESVGGGGGAAGTLVGEKKGRPSGSDRAGSPLESWRALGTLEDNDKDNDDDGRRRRSNPERRRALYDALVSRFGPVLVREAQCALLTVLAPPPWERSSASGTGGGYVGFLRLATPAPPTGSGRRGAHGRGDRAARPGTSSPGVDQGAGADRRLSGAPARVPFAFAAQQLGELRRTLATALARYGAYTGDDSGGHDRGGRPVKLRSAELHALLGAPRTRAEGPARTGEAGSHHQGHTTTDSVLFRRLLEEVLRPSHAVGGKWLYSGVVNTVTSWVDKVNGGLYILAGCESGRVYLVGGPLGGRDGGDGDHHDSSDEESEG